MKRKRIMAIVFMVTVMCALALGPAHAQKAAPQTIKIGALYEKTGTRFGWGLNKAVNKINADGGIFIKEHNKKIPIELVEADHQSKEDRAVTMAEYLADQGVVAIIGTTSVLPTAASVYEKNQIPTLATVSSMDAPFAMGYRYIFSNFPKFSDTGRFAATFFKKNAVYPAPVWKQR